MKTFYELLELEPNATKEEIKKAYMRLASIHHPDKGGEEEKFKLILKAYDILYNEAERTYYDQNGTTKSENTDRTIICERLAGLLLDIIDAQPSGDYMDLMKKQVSLKINEFGNLIIKANKLINKREKALEKIIKKDGTDNMFRAAITADVKNLNQSIKTSQEHIRLLELMLIEIDNYQYVSDEDRSSIDVQEKRPALEFIYETA